MIARIVVAGGGTGGHLFPGIAVVEELRRRGHQVSTSDAWSQGRLCVVGRDTERGLLMAAANPRGMQGYAAGR